MKVRWVSSELKAGLIVLVLSAGVFALLAHRAATAYANLPGANEFFLNFALAAITVAVAGLIAILVQGVREEIERTRFIGDMIGLTHSLLQQFNEVGTDDWIVKLR